MNKEEFIGKLQMVYVGDRNAIDDIISEYDRLNKEYERIYNENCKLREEHNITDIKLLDENNRLNNIIDELEKWIEEHKQYQLISERYIVWEDKLVNKLKALKENNK
ncbi:MAG: hypothetical protein IIV48_03220 [Clostridium sp.]|nr:hypothetical protein [Clostridium sp.]